VSGKSRIIALGTGLWLVGIVAGLGLLMGFESTPGDAGNPPASWPGGSTLVRSAGMWTLVMFVHPRCPCTRTSLSELERIMSRSRGRVQALVVFLDPSKAGIDWSSTDLWEKASAIRGVRAIKDLDGTEAERFHCVTSGHTLLYDTRGDRRFSGGITPGRGHEGDSTGSRAILDLVEGVGTPLQRTSIFGCSLETPVTAPRRR
jgi:hypothetical protein